MSFQLHLVTSIKWIHFSCVPRERVHPWTATPLDCYTR